jgi:hypothetical protein
MLCRDKNNNVIFNSIAAYFIGHLTAQFNIANKHVFYLKNTANEFSFTDTSTLANINPAVYLEVNCVLQARNIFFFQKKGAIEYLCYFGVTNRSIYWQCNDVTK